MTNFDCLAAAMKTKHTNALKLHGENRLVFFAENSDMPPPASEIGDDEVALKHRLQILKSRVGDPAKVEAQTDKALEEFWNDEAKQKVRDYLQNPATDIGDLKNASRMSNNTELAPMIEGGTEYLKAVAPLYRARFVGSIEDLIMEEIEAAKGEDKAAMRQNGSKLIEQLFTMESSAGESVDEGLKKSMLAVRAIEYLKTADIINTIGAPASRSALAKEMRAGKQHVDLDADAFEINGESWQWEQAHVLTGAIMMDVDPQLLGEFVLKDLIIKDTPDPDQMIVIARMENGCKGNLFTALVKKVPEESKQSEATEGELEAGIAWPEGATLTDEGSVMAESVTDDVAEKEQEALQKTILELLQASEYELQRLNEISTKAAPLPQDKQTEFVKKFREITVLISDLKTQLQTLQKNPTADGVKAVQDQIEQAKQRVTQLDQTVAAMLSPPAAQVAPAATPQPAPSVPPTEAVPAAAAPVAPATAPPPDPLAPPPAAIPASAPDSTPSATASVDSSPKPKTEIPFLGNMERPNNEQLNDLNILLEDLKPITKELSSDAELAKTIESFLDNDEKEMLAKQLAKLRKNAAQLTDDINGNKELTFPTAVPVLQGDTKQLTDKLKAFKDLVAETAKINAEKKRLNEIFLNKEALALHYTEKLPLEMEDERISGTVLLKPALASDGSFQLDSSGTKVQVEISPLKQNEPLMAQAHNSNEWKAKDPQEFKGFVSVEFLEKKIADW